MLVSNCEGYVRELPGYTVAVRFDTLWNRADDAPVFMLVLCVRVQSATVILVGELNQQRSFLR